MKQILRKLSLVALLSVCTFVGVTSARVVQRSQTVDGARNLAGWTNHINLFDMGGFYGSFAITPEYTHSFRGERLAENVFPTNGALGFCGLTSPAVCNTVNTGVNNGCNTDCNKRCGEFLVQGKNVVNRAPNALLGDYAGLPSDYSSVVTVCPKIQNFLVDFNLFLGLDEWLCGAWFRIHAPVVYAKWNLDYNETKVSGSGVAGYPAGYFAPAAVPVAQLNPTFGAYLAGGVPTLNNGVVFEPLSNSKLCGFNSSATSSCKNDCSSNSRHRTLLSDIEFAFGWNFWQDEDYHLGLGLVVRAPTGNRINDTFLFEPIIGNGHHWELGGLITSHYTFWRSCDYDQSLGLYVDAWITHLFKTTQWRSFDLTASRGLNNRYMLAEQFTTANVTVGGAGAGNVASAQFDGIYSPVANLTFQGVRVSVPVQADVVAMFNYTNCAWTWDLGYNFWGTSCEKIETCRNNILTGQNWALKGDASTYGFSGTSPVLFTALSATETGTCAAPLATICSGTNGVAITNPGVDNAVPAFIQPAGTVALLAAAGGAAIDTSLNPVLLTDADIDYCSNRAKGLTHKIFTHFAYTWEECDCYIPYLGIGGFAEFAQKSNRCDNDCNTNSCNTNSCNTNSCNLNTNSCNTGSCGTSTNNNNSCHNGAFSQWGIWLKGGVSFN